MIAHAHPITTKFYVPERRAAFVPRPRLIEQIEAGLTCKLILVSAPAGSGKTTLVSDFLRQSDLPAAWLSLDKGDNDPAQFLAYMISSLQQISAEIGQTAQDILQSSPSLPPSGVMPSLLNDIAAATLEFCFVLEDYHVIDNQAIHDILIFLLEHLPPRVHLIITSRADPPLALPRLRVRGHLCQVRAEDLRFSPREAADFLNQVAGLALSPEDVSGLEERTEGWIAGLQLAALSLQGLSSTEKHDFVAAFAGDDRYIFDYLIEEVLQQQPKPTQDFLLQTSILDRLSGSLCDAVTERNDSQTLLNYLERRNLFLVPLDNKRQWYRYHHLFADLLRYRLREQFPSARATLHARASRWFEQNGFVEEAIAHALAAEAYDRAADLIEPSAHSLFSSGKMPRIQQWMAQIPATLIAPRPRLYMIAAWLLFRTGQFNQLDTHLQCSPPLETMDDLLRGEYLILCANNSYIHGHFDDCKQQARQALDILPPEDIELRMPATTVLAWSYESIGEVATAIRYHQEVVSMGHQANILSGTIASLGMLVQDYAHQGEKQEAEATFARVCKLADERGVQWIPLLGPAYVGMGHVTYQQGQVDDAIQYLQEGIGRCQQWGGLNIAATRGYALLLDILQQEKRTEEAQRLLTEAQHFVQAHNIPAWVADLPSVSAPTPPSNSSRLLEPLTQRERDVLRLLVNGLSAPQIADELIVGVSTVRTHIKRIYDKLDVHSRREAINRAHELGLV